MKITQLRNATIIVEAAGQRILVDPMLAPQGALPPLRLLGGGRRRNPLVELPPDTDALLASVTACLITHCQKGHFDHLDRAGKHWLRTRQVPVVCTAHDAPYLRQRGLNVQPLAWGYQPQPLFGGQVTLIPCVHGTGLVGRLMEHGVGYFLELPGEPTLYLSGDTVLTPAIRRFLADARPDVCVLPAGGARFDLGGKIIMDAHDAMEVVELVSGTVIANHLEAISHCPVLRTDLLALAAKKDLRDRLLAPSDGEAWYSAKHEFREF